MSSITWGRAFLITVLVFFLVAPSNVGAVHSKRLGFLLNDALIDSKITNAGRNLLSDGQDAIRIACIGDSITLGEGSGNNELESYPATLQHLFDTGSSSSAETRQKYNVKKFAVSGATVLRNAKLSFWDRPELQQALDFKPNIVVSMFGTNDAKIVPFDQKVFAAAYTDLIKTFVAAASADSRAMRFFVATPPPIVQKKINVSNLQSNQVQVFRHDTVQKYPVLMAELVVELNQSLGQQGPFSFHVLRTFEELLANQKVAMFPEDKDKGKDKGGAVAKTTGTWAASPENEMSLKRCGDGVHPCKAGHHNIAAIVYRGVLDAQAQAQSQAQAQAQAQALAQVKADVAKVAIESKTDSGSGTVTNNSDIDKAKVDEDIPDTFYEAINVKGDLVTKALVLWTWMWVNPVRAFIIFFVLAMCSQVPWVAWICQILILCCISEGARSEVEPPADGLSAEPGRGDDNVVFSPTGSIALKRMHVASSASASASASSLKDV
jgi:acyl-CoA thioesterase-1